MLRLSASLPAPSEDEILCQRVLDTAAGLDLGGVEIKLGRDDIISQPMRGWLREALGSYDFTIYTHLPYLQGSINLAAPDEKLATRAIEILTEALSFTRSLGGSLANTHLGVAHGEKDPIERALIRLAKVREDARDLGIDISIENQESSCNGILNTPEDVERLLATRPDADLTYDPGHGNTHGFGVEAFLPALFPHIRYLHLHDNNGTRDEHLALGRGNLDLRHLFLELGRRANRYQDIPAVLELAPEDLKPSMDALKGLVRRSEMTLA